MGAALANIDGAVEHAVAVAYTDADRVNRIVSIRRIVDRLTALRSSIGNVFAVVTYEGQQAVCSCGETFSAGIVSHVKENPGHEMASPGTSYADLAKRVGFNPARAQQLIKKGRELVENGNGS